MPHVYVNELKNHVGETVTVHGWLYNKRSSGKLWFLVVRDGTGLVQCIVFKGNVAPEVFELAAKVAQESSLTLTGKVKKEDRAPGGYELDVSDLQVIQIAHDYPITPKEHGTAFLMEHRHLWLRSSRQHAILKIRHEIIKACRDFFDSRDFTLVDTPIFTPNACEGTTTLFETQYFDQTAYLTQSGQLYNEATAAAFGKVYCFGPTFRAEKSKTRRHLVEFWMIEPEVCFAELSDVMQLAEDMLVYMVGRVLEMRREELKVIERDLCKLENIKPPFPRLSYDDAAKLLKEKGSDMEWGGDFGGDDETTLSQLFDRPVMVHRYPACVKAFYMQPDPARTEVALCVDVLAPEGYGEIIGGGQRIHDEELLRLRIAEHHLPEEAFRWYLDLRRYGTTPHGGFGMGIERAVAWICGLEHVRETIPFPRMLYKIYP
ncbi:MAG TPA: asparagine--tRNA ligase [Acidobacteriota bacterium]|jgi:asparaginyl-tRNA synthetase|nr:asparagine--tRNA ligase [Acidobacteriota bacterium]